MNLGLSGARLADDLLAWKLMAGLTSGIFATAISLSLSFGGLGSEMSESIHRVKTEISKNDVTPAATPTPYFPTTQIKPIVLSEESKKQLKHLQDSELHIEGFSILVSDFYSNTIKNIFSSAKEPTARIQLRNLPPAYLLSSDTQVNDRVLKLLSGAIDCRVVPGWAGSNIFYHAPTTCVVSIPPIPQHQGSQFGGFLTIHLSNQLQPNSADSIRITSKLLKTALEIFERDIEYETRD